MTHRFPSEDVLERILPILSDHARGGASLEIRSLDPRVQHLSGVTPKQLDRACRHGAEPAAVVRRADGTLDVWIRHSPSTQPETLGYLRRTLCAEYGQEPLRPATHFGPVAGLDPSVRLVQASGASYTRADSLADFFAVSCRALDERLEKRLEAKGIPRLAGYRTANPGPRADHEWSRFALRQGLAPRDVALELVRSGSRAAANPRAQTLYASRVLASTLPATSSRALPAQLLATGAQLLGVSTNVLSAARFVITHAVRLTLGRT